MIALLAALLGCTPPPTDGPLTATCDPGDPTACLLPWPSSRFMAQTDAGPRLAIDPAALPVPDRTEALARMDGFSRITGVAAGFAEVLDEDAVSWDPAASLLPDAPVQVLRADGSRVAYRYELIVIDGVDGGKTLVVGHPAEVLDAEADHVWVVLDTIGATAPAPRAVRVALGLVAPKGAEERALADWHAATRATLERAGIDPERVLRVADFRTRSHADVTRRLHHMIATLDGTLDALSVEIDSAVTTPAPEIAVIVRGRLLGAPDFTDRDGFLVLDDGGLPEVVGTAPIEFRISVPAGDGDYRLVLYGHGTGGNVSDPAWDRELGAHGIAKLGMRYDGWTDEDFVQTLLDFSTFFRGSERSTAGLMQSIAGGATLLTALDGVLGEVLASDTILGAPNPAAGRRPRTDDVAWAGGSMGGTMGAVIVSADPRLDTAVLNVPGAGWTHMVPHSLLFAAGMEDILLETYDDRFDIHHALVMSQGLWDDVDGAVWTEEALSVGGAFLLQESMGDPVLPNHGTELLARAFDAIQLDPSLQDVVGLDHTTEVVHGGATLTQFRVPDTGAYDVHGFAARQTPAADAALGQILHFLETAWAGDPQMRFPEGCAVTPDGSCDFTDVFE